MKLPVQGRALSTSHFHLTVLLRAGLCATLALVVGDGIVGALGWPSVDYAPRVGAWLSPGSPSVWATGLFALFFLGALLLPLAYAAAHHRLPASHDGRTMVIAALQWLALAVVVAPATGLGLLFTSSDAPIATALVALGGQLVYAGIFGEMTREEEGEVLAVSKPPALTEGEAPTAVEHRAA